MYEKMCFAHFAGAGFCHVHRRPLPWRVPTDTVVQNLNGSQQVIKTFTVAPDEDPQTLIEEPFELEGYLYTFKDITKVENLIDDTKRYTEVVTVETTDDDLSVILEKLMPTIEYDDGQYHGTLTLDHTSLYTEATSYSTRSYTVSETKTIGQLDRNDMSYVPATTVKNGVTLSLADVDWQVTGTDLVGRGIGAILLSGGSYLFRESVLYGRGWVCDNRRICR